MSACVMTHARTTTIHTVHIAMVGADEQSETRQFTWTDPRTGSNLALF